MKLFATFRSKTTRNAQLQLLSKAVQLEETTDPRLTRLTMLSGSAIVFSFIVWCAFAELNELARTPGTVEPIGQERVVQHPDGGVVDVVHVQEGQTIAPGDLIVTLAGRNLRKDLTRAKRRLRQLRIDETRLRAYLDNQKPDFAAFGTENDDAVRDALATHASQLAALADRVEIAKRQRVQRQRDLAALCEQFDSLTIRISSARETFETRQSLLKKGIVTRSRVAQAHEALNKLIGEINVIGQRIEAGTEAIQEYDTRIDAITSEDIAINFNNLNTVLAQAGETMELVEKLEKQVGSLEIRAPVGGIIKGLRVTEPGEVIQSATTLTKIVPVDEKLVASVRISPRDIGHVEVGLPVQIKVSAYDFGRYGAIEGRLRRISPGTFQDEKGNPYYSGQVELSQMHVGPDPALRPIAPGMLISANIVTGSKSILQYLLQPVYASLSVALTER